MKTTPSAQSRRIARRYYQVPIAIRIIGGLLILIAVGTLLLSLPGISTTRRLTFDQALFTAVSAVCVTGLSIITPSQDLTLFGQIVLAALIQLGGVGYMVIVVVVLRALHRTVSLVDRLALRASLGLPEREEFAPILRRVLLSILVIEGAGAVLLWLNWRERVDIEHAVWYGIFHAISAFCNAGFDLFTGLPGFPAGIPHDAPTLLILGTVIVLGGLGFPVLAEIVSRNRHRGYSLHARLTLSVSFVLIVVGAAGILLSESAPGGLYRALDWPQRILFSTFQSVSARTAGFSVFGSMNDLMPATQWVLIGLMLIGTGPASMGGGITTGTFVVLILSVWSYARGFAQVRVGQRMLPRDTLRRAAAVITVSFFLTTLATWLLLITHQATMEQALFETVSAFATTGLSLDLTSQLNGFGQAVDMFMMIWGRLGVLTIILALARQRPPEPVAYPEETVLIG
jgi:trk system potassium uptake protein TrkH